MSLLKEIHRQPTHIRAVLWGLSAFTMISVTGYFWFTSVEREMFVAIHDDPGEQEQFFAQQDARAPKPLAAISATLGSLTASIGSLMGIDQQEGFDRSASEDKVYLLPLSK